MTRRSFFERLASAVVVGLALPQPIGAPGELVFPRTFGFVGPDYIDSGVDAIAFHPDAFALVMKPLDIDPASYPTMAALRQDVHYGRKR